MSVGTHSIHRHLTVRESRAQTGRMAPALATAIRRPRAAWDQLHYAGQLGPVFEAELGRRFGARI